MRRVLPLLVVAALSTVTACSGSGSAPQPSASATSASASASPSDQLPSKPESVVAALPGIERFVEQERGLRFRRPVIAKVLRRKPFLAKLDKGDPAPTPKEIEQTIATLSALGLISAHVDIAKVFKTADDESTLGFYNVKTKRLYVRGNHASPGVRAVLAHELTHALTDQWFGLHRPKLDKSEQELGLGFDALTEGDAERTRKAYEARVLSPAERTHAEHEENAGGTPHVPLVVLEVIGFPYVVGPEFVHAVVAQGGLTALNAAYRQPPTSSEQLFDPASYFNHDAPKHVPTRAADGVRVDHGDLGLIGLLLMFEHGLSRSRAQLAVTGWGGDQYVAWRAGDRRWCLRDSVVMDYGLATNVFNAALKAWVATRGGKAQIEKSGATTTFVTCSS